MKINFILLFLIGLLTYTFAQVTLPNGVTVPKDHMIVLIFAGNSNMCGRGRDPQPDDALFATPHPRVWSYNVYDSQNPPAPGATGNSWKAAYERNVYRNGFNSTVPKGDKIHSDGGGGHGDGYGPAVPLMKKFADAYPAYTFGILDVSGSGLGLKQNFISDIANSNGDKAWTNLKRAIGEIRSKVTFAGCLVMFGGAGGNLSLAQSYGTDCINFRNLLQTETQSSHFFLINTQWPAGGHLDDPMISTVNSSPTVPYHPEFNAAIELLPSRDGSISFVPDNKVNGTNWSDAKSGGNWVYMQDYHHFSLAGHKYWANVAFNIIQNKQWIPGAASISWNPTPPSPQSLELYANSFSSRGGRFTVALPQRGAFQLQVYDAAGRSFLNYFSEEESQGYHAVSVLGSKPAPAFGVYTVMLRQNGNRVSQKYAFLR